MPQISDKQAAIVLDLIRNAWQTGAIRSPQMGAEVQELAVALTVKPKEKPVKEKTE